MILLLDNYDSFTYNLYQYLSELGAEIEVERNDALTPDDVFARGPEAIVISPGPCTPDDAGISLALIAANAARGAQAVPLLGVCLGHQSLAQHFGGRIIRAEQVMHGKTSPIHHDGSGVFAGLPNPFEATRYHSLIAERASLPECLRVTAWTEDETIMGLEHRELPLHGVQFHPESILTGQGKSLLANFLRLAGVKTQPLTASA